MGSEDWDNFWRLNIRPIYALGNWFYWQFIYNKLFDNVNKTGLSVLELGGGAGTVSLKMAKKYDAEVTIVDFSEECRKLAISYFSKNGKKLDFRCEDMLKFKTNKKFDLVHSEGVVEHFSGSNRVKVVKKHLELLKGDGKAIIIAPIKNFLHPLRLFILHTLHMFDPKIYEEPFSLQEFEKIVSQIPGYHITKKIETPLDVAVRIERKA